MNLTIWFTNIDHTWPGGTETTRQNVHWIPIDIRWEYGFLDLILNVPDTEMVVVDRQYDIREERIDI